MSGDDSDSVLCITHFYRGLIYQDTGDKAVSRRHKEMFMEQQRSICASVGPDFVDVRLGLAFAEMGIAHAEDGELDESIQAHRREMDIRKQLGITSLVSRDANYAWALLRRGDVDVAEQVLDHCVEIWESTGSDISLR